MRRSSPTPSCLGSTRGSPAALASAALFLWLTTPAAFALVDPVNCQVDPRGANDRPGQRDVTMFCVDAGDGAPFDLVVAVQLDEIDVRGANTIDSCSMFDTDDDGLVDLAACVTLESSGAALDNLTRLRELRLFTCADTKADKCMNSVLVLGPYVSECEVSHPDNDPFSPVDVGGPGSDYPWDTRVVCGIDFGDFGVASADLRMMDGCSFPSTVPNSDADDCILYAACSTADDCDDANPCSLDTCDAAGFCVHLAGSPGAACTDGLFCNGSELCNPLGFCESSGIPQDCDDGLDCTVDECDDLDDTCTHDPRPSLCDDGAFCNGVEDCDPAAGCVAGAPVNCADDVACTVDACDEDGDSCTHEPSDAACDDGRFCTGTESCDAESGCVPGAPPDCGDSVACTTDRCSESADACEYIPADDACDDGLFCTGQETCHATLGCQPGTLPDCDDGVACTADACDEDGDRCAHAPEDAACDDGAWCNGAETCDAAGGCVGGPGPCPPPAVCDEDLDLCLGCVADEECDDGSFCNGAESCVAGHCLAGLEVSCDDALACTEDRCSEAAGACVRTPVDARCDNGLYCDGEESCDPAAGCVPGTAPDCDDGVACTADSCEESARRCANAPDDGRCDNGFHCDGVETCDPTADCQEGEPVECRPDRYQCSVESCNELTDACESDFSRCVCGDLEIIPPEECDPPRRAGTFEDCNNLVDDNANGLIDCEDPECAHDSGRGRVCDEDCRLDLLCARIGKDPASMQFHRRGRPDRLKLHGRFPIDAEPDPVTDGFAIEISNGRQPVYRASLGTGDLIESRMGGGRYLFLDREAAVLGAASRRDGLCKVSLIRRSVDGVPHIAFRVLLYGDLSAATERWMATQVSVGSEVAELYAEWRAKKKRWILRLRDF